MKLKTIAASLALGSTILAGPLALAEQISQAELTDMIASSSASTEELVAQLLSQYPEMVEAVVAAVVAAKPEAAAEVVSAALNAAPQAADTVIRSAISAAPEAVSSIAQVAQAANVSNEVVTQAAISAGVDPTQVAQATAAGTPSAPPPPAAAPVSVSGS
ncbi:hypothetical protein [Vibrio sp. TBV020]|uniref:hypothetical protein n=1 Tax=Vibrio sp. TBV020 TaxID=3137398 RepID=UPI0038CD29E4